MAIRVAFIDDHEVARLGVARLLKSVPSCEFVGAFATVPELLSSTKLQEVDVVLLDLRLNDNSDPYFNVAALRDHGLDVLVYSSLESPYLLRRALQSGVNGVVDKSASAETVEAAITAVHRDGTYASSEWAGAIDADGDFAAVHLSVRQREVLELYAMGESAKRVGAITGLSVDTVHDYIQRIRTKYAVEGREAKTKIDLFRRAQEDGYIPGPWEN